MLEQRRARVVRAMVGVLLVFGVSLAYFLFFNSGLQLTSDPSDQFGKVVIANESVHLIRNISLVYLKSGVPIPLESVPDLKPGDHHVVLLKPDYVDQGKFTIQVSAPFHLGKQIVIDARSIDPGVVSAQYSFQYPTIGVLGQPVDSTVETCSQESFPISAIVTLSFAPPSSEVEPDPIPFVIPPNACQSVVISFIPTRATDDLPFKIRVSTPSSTLVEKMHSIQVISPSPSVDTNTGPSPDANADVNGSV